MVMSSQKRFESANSRVRNALAIRRDNPKMAFRMLVAAADIYEELELWNLSQNTLEYAFEIQCDFMGGENLKRFGSLIRDARIQEFAKHLEAGEA